ncbi:MAG: type VI secretion system-associated protein TagF [Pseudomonadota bacterium]
MFGAFGKIPAVGDFFRIDPPKGFVSVWDAWLQQGLLETREVLQDGWKAKYYSAPIWRFTLTAGLAGKGAVIGVLMPSIDRVGRQFPLTLMGDIADDPLFAHFALSDLFAKLEDIALATLDDNVTKDHLADMLSAVQAPPVLRPPVRAEKGALVAGPAPTGSLAAMLAAEAGGTPTSVWSSEVEDGQRLMLCDGLPVGAQIMALYDLDAPLWTGARAA